MDRGGSSRRKSSLAMPSSKKKSRPSSSSSNFGFRSTRKSTMTPSHSRASIAPSKSIKDPRQLENHSIRKKEVFGLYNFLLEIGFQNDKFALERLHPPSNSMYQAIFTYLINHLFPDWELVGKLKLQSKKPEESMLNILRTLGYPYAVSKSHLSNVVPGTWPQALGALLWLTKVVKYTVDCVPKTRELLEEDPMLKAKHFFFRRCYEDFMDDNDGPYVEVEAQVQTMIDAVNKDRNEMIEENEKELERIQNSYKEKLEKKVRYDSTVEAIESERTKITKVNEYIQKVEHYIAEKQRARAKTEEEIKEKKSKLMAVQKSIVQMKSTVSLQKYSQSDMERKQVEMKNWEEQLAEMEEKNKNIEKEFNTVSAKLLKAKQKDSELIYQVNEEIRSYLTCTDDAVDLIEGDFDVNNFLLKASEEDPQKNKHRLMVEVKPFMNTIHDQLVAKRRIVTEECQQTEYDLTEAEDRNVKTNEDLKTAKEETTRLEAKIEKLKEECLEMEREQTKNEEKYKKTTEQTNKEDEDEESKCKQLEDEIKKIKEENIKLEEDNRKKLEAFQQQKEGEWTALRDEYNSKKEILEKSVEKRQQEHKKWIGEMMVKISEVEKSGSVMDEIEGKFRKQQELADVRAYGTDEEIARVENFLQRTDIKE